MRRALVAAILWLAVAVLAAPSAALAGAGASSDEEPEPPRITVNEFMPEERPLSDCVSVLPKPGCGSEARGGPHQAAVFGAMVLGLGLIGTRIVVGIRRRDRIPLDPSPSPDRAPGPSPDP